MQPRVDRPEDRADRLLVEPLVAFSTLEVFEVAADLFYREGIHAVGVDAIVKKAGVAKISLYRRYASKDDLIVAYLEERAAGFWRQWDEICAPWREDPRAELRVIVDHIAHRTTRPGYRGCPFINYCAEFPDASHPGRRVAENTKREMRRRLLDIAKRLDALSPGQLADGLLLLIEGAYAISLTLGGSKGPGNALVEASMALVDSHAKTLPSQ